MLCCGLVPKALGSLPGGWRKLLRRNCGIVPPLRRRRCLVVICQSRVAKNWMFQLPVRNFCSANFTESM